MLLLPASLHDGSLNTTNHTAGVGRSTLLITRLVDVTIQTGMCIRVARSKDYQNTIFASVKYQIIPDFYLKIW